MQRKLAHHAERLMLSLRQIRLLAVLGTACLPLAACGEGAVAERLGLERKAPDEFQVLSRPPLSIPPEFNLEAPTDGSEGLIAPAARRGEQSVFSNRGGNTIGTGSADTAVTPVTSGEVATMSEQNILNRAGAANASSDIRTTLRKESGELGEDENKSILETLREANPKKEVILAPEKEAERIKKNIESGKPINEGEIEVVEPKDRGILDKLDGIF